MQPLKARISGTQTFIVALALCISVFSVGANDVAANLVEAALERTTAQVRCDGRYIAIPYPGGDVPPSIGVCTDVVIRAYRTLNIDLQKLVHEDMAANFDAYPSKRLWGLTRTDKNIDHRRVPNLRVFFSRYGENLPIASSPADFQPGDIVSWRLPGNLPHIGIVTNEFSEDRTNRLIVHNIGAGPMLEDVLFAFPITGHYRYFPQ